ncbi:uncharacterized protein ABDE67_019384 isoform 4-T4 [Symphorus nematophorus]
MASSVLSGLALMCLTVLPFLLAQVQPQNGVIDAKGPGPRPPCCVTASNATIRQNIDACFEQKEKTFGDCKIHAYIFEYGNKICCVDARAGWIPQRLERLKARGIYCQVL